MIETTIFSIVGWSRQLSSPLLNDRDNYLLHCWMLETTNFSIVEWSRQLTSQLLNDWDNYLLNCWMIETTNFSIVKWSRQLSSPLLNDRDNYLLHCWMIETTIFSIVEWSRQLSSPLLNDRDNYLLHCWMIETTIFSIVEWSRQLSFPLFLSFLFYYSVIKTQMVTFYVRDFNSLSLDTLLAFITPALNDVILTLLRVGVKKGRRIKGRNFVSKSPVMVTPIREGLDIETPVIGYTNRRRFGYFFSLSVFFFSFFFLWRHITEKVGWWTGII